MDLYFSTIYNENQIPRVEFLTLAQSVEAYHRITVSGKFTLRERLAELAKKHDNLLKVFIGDAEEFSAAISELRNKLTHPNEETANLNKDYRKFLKFSERMALLLEVCFLNEIGFNQEQIKEIILNRSKRANRLHQGWV